MASASCAGSGDDGLRHRKAPQSKGEFHASDDQECDRDVTEKQPEAIALKGGTYWLTRIVFLRSLGFIYFVAFTVALHQNKQLIGSNGLLPANHFMDKVKNYAGGINAKTWNYVPTVLWFFDYEAKLDVLLDGVALSGMVLSGFLVVFGSANWIIMISLWILYHSLVNIGQRWYGFGWESQLLETGFLAIFFCPVLSLRRLPRHTPPSRIVIWGYRWLIFRIMLGAGLIKIRGDQCWRDLTCMNYHYETQPVPNPVAYYLHMSPEFFHQFETLVNHFVELIAPFFLMPLLPRPFHLLGGGIQIFFQCVLIVSGNLSFLNWLTILPSICCFDDASLSCLFSSKRGSLKHRVWEIQEESRRGMGPVVRLSCHVRRICNIMLGVLIVYLSVPVVQNLLSPRQAMNTSFDSMRLVNTYGAFGSVTKERTEVIFQGTYADNPNDPSAIWETYEFKCKPGNVNRRPCLISPYHYRLDWLMWFSAFQSYNHNPWLIHLAIKFLVNDEQATSLIEHNPFEGRDPPRWIRAEHYRYTFPKVGSNAARKGQWWKRKRIGEYLPPISIDPPPTNLVDFAEKHGWKIPQVPPRKHS